jgi:hypothetical protein
MVKELQCFESDTILAFYNIFTTTPKKYPLQEFCTILQEAQSMTQEVEPTDFFWPMEDLPSNSTLLALELCLQSPKLPGQDTSHFSKMSWWAQANWKAFHLECDYRFAADIKKLNQLAKESDLVTKMWGKHAHISEVVDKVSTPSEIKRLIKVMQSHTNYQCSMLLEVILGITNLDATTTYLLLTSLRQMQLAYPTKKVICPTSRRLNTKIPRVAENYARVLEEKVISHRLIEHMGTAHWMSKSRVLARRRLNKLDKELGHYLCYAEKKCCKIKSGWIPFSPEASLWIPFY